MNISKEIMCKIIKAQSDLLVYYRLGKHPSEKTLDILRKYQEEIEEIRKMK